MPGQSSGPSLPPRQEALTAIVLGDDPLALELLLTLRERGLEASAVPQALALEAVRSMAPDLLVVVCPHGESVQPVLERLGEAPASALLPVVLVSEEQPSAQARAFTQGVVAGIGRERGAAAIAELVLRTLVDLPARSGESQGTVEEATLDQLVGLLSRELRTGVLSVQGESEARIVLRAGQPLDQRVDSFIERVRPLLQGEGGARYAFQEQASARLDSVRSPHQAPSAPELLLGRRVLVAHPSATVADAWVRALRDAGAQTAALSDPLAPLDAVRSLDPHVVLIDPEAGDAAFDALLSRLRDDAQLRWAAALMAPLPPKDAAAAPTPDAVRAVAHKITELTAPLADLERRARHDRSFEARLEQVGPSQLLRALLGAERKLRVRVRHPEAGIQLDVESGVLAGASAVCWEREDETLTGHEALSLLLSLRTGRVHVESIAGSALDNLQMPLELALTMLGARSTARARPLPAPAAPRAHAAPAAPVRADRSAPLAPSAARPLVSEIPRAPRLPRVGPGATRRRVSELGHKAARLLLSPERDVGSGSRLALLLLACVVGAGLGLPAQLDPLRLGNQPARVQVAASSAPLGNAGASRGQAAVKAPADDTAQVEAAEARTAAGDALRARGRLLAAEAEYLRALVDRPNHPGALEGLARLMLARRDAAAATDWALRLASVAPDAAHVQLLLGEAHVLAGRTPSAVEAFTRAEALGAPEARAQLDALALRDAAATPK